MTQSVTDVSMASKLKSDKYYTEKRETATVASGESLEILASSGTKITTVESISKVLSLAAIIHPSIASDINEFSPILTKWHSLTFKEKCQKYSSHICNELNVFIYFKDREFFNQVIMPFIKSKLIKCFIDKWLLREDLMEYVEYSKKFNTLNDFEVILLYQSFKDDSSIAEKLKSYIESKIQIMEKKNKTKVNEMKKIFDTIIENGEELNDDDDDDDEDEDIEMEEEECNDECVAEAEMMCEEECFDICDAPASSMTRGMTRGMTRSSANTFKSINLMSAPMSAPGMAPMNALGMAPMDAPGMAPMAPMALNAMVSMAPMPQMMGASRNIKSMKKLDDVKSKIKKEGAMFYEEIEKTTVWSETGNWKSSINETIDIKMNPYWKDVFKSSNDQGKILSKNFLSILNKSFTELIFACALMDLPLTSKDNQEVTIKAQIYKINTKSNIIVLFKQLMVNTELYIYIYIYLNR